MPAPLLRFAVATLLCGLASAHADSFAVNPSAEPLTAARIAALPTAAQPAWRDYLERSARQGQADRATLRAELAAQGLKTPLEPPSGHGAASLPLNRSASWYASADARRLADIVVSFQTPGGGWSKNLDLAQHARRPGEHYAPDNSSKSATTAADNDAPADFGWHFVSTFDNDATIAEIRFLAKAVTAPGDASGASCRAAALRGIEFVLAAQYPNGGWPQVWPLEGGYHDAVTFNDGAVTGIVSLLRDVAAGRAGFDFVPSEMRRRAAAAEARGLDCILACQIVVAGRRTVWCQQHDALTLLPTSARNYEMPAQCSAESASLVGFLMELPSPDARVIEAVRAAVTWFEATAIHGQRWAASGAEGRQLVPAADAPPLWARYYEMGTDRPLFGDRDKSIHYDVREISAERRNGYSWYGNGPGDVLKRYTAWIRSTAAK